MKKSVRIFTLALSALMVTGCVTLDADHTLLGKTTPNAQPLVPQNYAVEVEMNERIALQATAVGIEKLVYQSLQTALQKANIFTPNGRGYYKVRAKILQASQSAVSFGRFPGKMEIEYTVTNQDSDPVFVKKIYNEGESDKFFFTGAKRHTRSRIVTVADNVNQFVQEFNDMMKANEKADEKNASRK